MTTGLFTGLTSATDWSPKRRICRSMRWICWAKTCTQNDMPCAKPHICAKRQRTCQDFFLFFTGFFGNFRGIFVSFHNNSKLFAKKAVAGTQIKACVRTHLCCLCALVTKKKSPSTGQMQGFAALSTRYGAQSPASHRIAAPLSNAFSYLPSRLSL